MNMFLPFLAQNLIDFLQKETINYIIKYAMLYLALSLVIQFLLSFPSVFLSLYHNLRMYVCLFSTIDILIPYISNHFSTHSIQISLCQIRDNFNQKGRKRQLLFLHGKKVPNEYPKKLRNTIR